MGSTAVVAAPSAAAMSSGDAVSKLPPRDAELLRTTYNDNLVRCANQRDAAIRDKDDLDKRWLEHCRGLEAERDALRAALVRLRDACIASQDFVYAEIATTALAGAAPQPGEL